MSYVLDTNIISAILKGNEKVKRTFFDKIKNGDTILLSAIAYYEIKRGLLKANATAQISRFETFANKCGLLMIDSISMLDKAAETYAYLMNSGNDIGDADILIASSAMDRKFIVVTDNVKHFRQIPKLQYENWLN